MTSNRDITKEAALYLLKRGIATHAEAAHLAGVSRQLMRLWARDIPNARNEYLKLQWEAAVKAVKQANR